MTTRAAAFALLTAFGLAAAPIAAAQTTLGGSPYAPPRNGQTPTAPTQAPAQAQVFINGAALDQSQIDMLISYYGQVYPGRYWYDPISGLWGHEGGPPTGQGAAGVQMGGPLQANASGGGDGQLTGTFINGREIHPQEYQFYLSVFGTVYPGRFWMTPDGTIGYEGGPAIASLAQAAQGGYGGGGQGWTGRYDGLTAGDNAVFGGDGSGCYYYGGNDGTSWSNC